MHDEETNHIYALAIAEWPGGVSYRTTLYHLPSSTHTWYIPRQHPDDPRGPRSIDEVDPWELLGHNMERDEVRLRSVGKYMMGYHYDLDRLYVRNKTADELAWDRKVQDTTLDFDPVEHGGVPQFIWDALMRLRDRERQEWFDLDENDAPEVELDDRWDVPPDPFEEWATNNDEALNELGDDNE